MKNKIFRVIRRVFRIVRSFIEILFVKLIFWLNDVSISKGYIVKGIPVIDIVYGGKLVIGSDFKMNSGKHYNKIGRQQPCMFIINKDAKLTIGNNVGISSTAFVCQYSITIEEGVRIGGNCVIYDTDFHSIYPEHRLAKPEELDKVKNAAVLLKKNAFIGAHSTILKGVVIGENAVIGAGSVVSRNIPDNEVWAGNPIRFIKKINNQ
jgi:acetyltransferase-like isoleucine patch superfamily enzyme